MGTVTIKNDNKLEGFAWPFWITKIIRFEFWPFWVLYFPVFIYYLWLSLKARSLSFFTAANPGIYLGGFAGESKIAILSSIESAHLPQTLFFKAGTTKQALLKQLQAGELDYPFVLKPNVGERGDGVEKIMQESDLDAYLLKYQQDFIAQTFVNLPIEVGVLYYKMPDGSKSGISSVVIKSFLSIEGNGKDTLHQLILASDRAQLRLDYLLNKFKNRLNQVLPKGELLLLEPIGNHCRGTTFLSGQSLINPQMVAVFDSVAKNISGFYIGRFDLKVNEINDLYTGNHIKILELNGVTSEPAHIYDPNCTLMEAYRALFNHYRLLFEIGCQNNRMGISNSSFGLVWKEIKKSLAK